MKKLLISHGSDPDGAMPVILNKLLENNFDILFLEVDETNQTILNLVNNCEYDEVIMTDLSIDKEICEKIKNTEFVKKFHIFDHHEGNKVINEYPFVTLIYEQNNQPMCATTIYYEYLKTQTTNPILEKEVVKQMVEITRQLDTYEFKKTNNHLAKQLNDLYDIYGREKFIDRMLEIIKSQDTFYYNEKENYLFQIEQIKLDRYINEKEKTLIKANIDSYHFGIVFAELYRSEVGNELSKRHPELEAILIINLDRSVSVRTTQNFDTTIFTKKHGGNGHKKASGHPLPIDIKQKVLRQIYDKVEMK